jgi:predicted DNA-binding transcriptional regulator AlpA
LTAPLTASQHCVRDKRVEIGPTYPPRAFRAEHAAAYLAMSKASFLRLVEDGTIPSAIKIKGMAIWDRHDLDDAFEELKRRSQQAKPRNSMDALLGITDEEGE